MNANVRFALACLLAAGRLLVATPDIAGAQGKACFVDHGIAAAVSEDRSTDAIVTDDGRPMVLTIESSGGGSSLLAIDARTGETTQHFYPSEMDPAGGVFTRLWSSNGKYYLVLDSKLVEFDPMQKEWTFEGELKPSSLAMSFAEAPNGMIYVATYPRAELYRYDPERMEITYLTQLDPSEKYPYFLAVDDDGWIYSGLGTVHSTLVAYHPERDEKELIYETTLRAGEGTAVGAIPEVYRGVNGEIYGEAWPGGPWLHLKDGDAREVRETPERIRYRSAKFTQPLTEFTNGGELRNFSLPAGSFEYVAPDGTVHEVSFDYESRGAGITRLIEGPDDMIYGGTSHPMQFFHYSPETDELVNRGGIPKVGGGNFPAYAIANGKLYGTAYVGGHLYEIDPSKDWNPGSQMESNPRYLESFSRYIGRPRVMQVHGNQLIIGGFSGYGEVGGGLALYDLDTNESTVIPNRDLVRGHSTVAMRVLEDNRLVGGTSIAAPGGADPIAEEAVIYVYDIASRELEYSVPPIDGSTRIAGIEHASQKSVFALTGQGLLFEFDLERREVVHRLDLHEYGGDVGADQSLRWSEEGHLLVLLQDGIVRVKPASLQIEHTVKSPTNVTAGIGLLDGQLYFASDTNVWSYDWARCAR